MINHTKTILAVVLTSLSQSALSADWNVIQTSNVGGSNPVLTQNQTSSSTQAINGIVLDTANDSIRDSSQTTTLSGNSISLTQSGAGTNSNVQAVNVASANSITNLTQQVSGLNEVQIEQNSTSGAGNVQALNYAIASGNTDNLSQSVNGNSLTLSTSLAGNIQAVNYSESASYTGSLTQNATITNVDVTNLGGNATRINSVQGDVGGLSTPLSQTTALGTVTVNGGSTLILNHVAP